MDADTEKTLEPIADSKISTSMGIAAIALNMAMKYHDMAICKDGALYQQYKLEGKNMQPIQIDFVFETAMEIELHLLAGEKRITALIVDAIYADPPADEERDPEQDIDEEEEASK